MVFKKPIRPDPEALVAALLVFLAADEERFSRFLALTGLLAGDLRGLASTPGFAESLLDYVSSDETLLCAFAEDTGHNPREIEAARLALAPPPFEF